MGPPNEFSYFNKVIDYIYNIIKIFEADPQFYKNVPLPSWIELSLIDVCNRICSFCPKSDFDIAPNTYQKMNLKFINKLYEELKEIGFQGAFSICGYGEPLLHKDLVQFVNIIGELGGVEIVTNGDPLKPLLLNHCYLIFLLLP